MVFTIADWTFQLDLEKNLAYSGSNLLDHCQCGYCRNYYTAIDQVHPGLRTVLAQFGAHVEAPNELLPYEPTIYQATYCVCGNIVQRGNGPIMLGGLELSIIEQAELDFDTSCPTPLFAISTSIMELPWLLEEDKDEVISPANEPECLQRMWSKLLQQVPQDQTFS